MTTSRHFERRPADRGRRVRRWRLRVALINTLKTNRPMSVPVPDPGRANVIACGRYLPGENSECGWANDPREAGLAMGAN